MPFIWGLIYSNHCPSSSLAASCRAVDSVYCYPDQVPLPDNRGHDDDVTNPGVDMAVIHYFERCDLLD